MMKKSLAFVLALIMVLSLVPAGLFTLSASAATEANPEDFYRVFHLDAGRKYFSLNTLEKYVDAIADAGFNQMNLYLSDNQGLRVKLDDMTVTTADHVYDLSGCVGDGYTDGAMIPCSVDGTDTKGYLTAKELQQLIQYAQTAKNVQIVPCINTPAHMGAILAKLTYADGTVADFRQEPYGLGSERGALKLSDPEACEFMLAMTEKFIDFFAGAGCEYYCIGGDEWMTGYTREAADSFAVYANALVPYAKLRGVTLRMFNDAFTSGTDALEDIRRDYEIYYWSNVGERLAPQDLADAGFKLINTPENLYYVLRSGDSPWWLRNVDEARIRDFDVYGFSNSKGSWGGTYTYVDVTKNKGNVVGSTLCVWCDSGTAETTSELLGNIQPLMKPFIETVNSTVDWDAFANGSTGIEGGGEGSGEGSGGAGGDTDATEPVAPGTDFRVDLFVGGDPISKTFTSDTDLGLTDGNVVVNGTAIASYTVTMEKNPIPAPGGDVTKGDLISKDYFDKMAIGSSIDCILNANTNMYIDGNGKYITDAQNAGIYKVEKTGNDTYAISCNGKYIQTPASPTGADPISFGDAKSNWKYTDANGFYFEFQQRTYHIASRNNGWEGADILMVGWNVYTYLPYAAQTSGGGEETFEYVYTLTFTGLAVGEKTEEIGGKPFFVHVDGPHDHVGESRDCQGYICDVCNAHFGAGITQAEVEALGGDWNDAKWHVKNADGKFADCWLTESGDNVKDNPDYMPGLMCANEECGHIFYYARKLSNASINVAMFITNNTVSSDPKEEQNNDMDSSRSHIITINASEIKDGQAVESEAGCLLELLLPDETTLHPFGEAKTVLRYVRGTKHPEGHWQCSKDGGNWSLIKDSEFLSLGISNSGALDKTIEVAQTHYGLSEPFGVEDFYYIRYWKDSWDVSADGVNWTKVNVGTATTGDQLVARYMQVTDVTSEVTTIVQDWGTQTDNGQCTLDFAVHYASGDVRPNPDTHPFFLDGKTILYEAGERQTKMYNDGTNNYRWVDNIIGENTDDREIYMITLTPSNGQTGRGKKYEYPTYYNNYVDGKTDIEHAEQIVWLLDAEQPHPDYPIHKDFQWGTTPENDISAYPELSKDAFEKAGITDIRDVSDTRQVPLVRQVMMKVGEGMLVTYYIRAKQDTDANKPQLGVHYCEVPTPTSTDKSNEFHSYGIVVANDTVTFDSRFTYNNKVPYGVDYGTVVNDLGFTQQVDHRLSIMADVPAKPKYEWEAGILQYVNAERSADGKDVYLYYCKNMEVHDFVVDFGLPVQINLEDLGFYGDPKLIESVDFLGSELIEDDEYTLYRCPFGTLYELEDNTGVVYIPTKVMTDAETITMKVTYKASEGQPSSREADVGEYTFRIIPATTVYYEPNLTSKDGNTNLFITYDADKWSAKRNEHFTNVEGYGPTSRLQQTATAGMSGAYNYGYDSFYDNAGVAENYMVTKTPGASATFSFTGTGFDLYASCTPNTGSVGVKLYTGTGDTKELDRIYIVDTRNMGGEDSNITGFQSNLAEIYSIPIVSEKDLAYGDYTVVLMYLNSRVDNDQRTDGFRFDGFRVYNTMGDKMNDVYALDGEANPEYVEVRDIVLNIGLPEELEGLDSVYADQLAAAVMSQIYAQNLETKGIVGALIYKRLIPEGNTTGNPMNDIMVSKDLLDNGPKNELYLRQNFGNGKIDYTVSRENLWLSMTGAQLMNMQLGMKNLVSASTADGSNLHIKVLCDTDFDLTKPGFADIEDWETQAPWLIPGAEGMPFVGSDASGNDMRIRQTDMYRSLSPEIMDYLKNGNGKLDGLTPNERVMVQLMNMSANDNMGIISLTSLKLLGYDPEEVVLTEEYLTAMFCAMGYAMSPAAEAPVEPADPTVHGTSKETAQPYIQPTGAHDAYKAGEWCVYNGEYFVSLIDGNVWTPDAYPQGWQKCAETAAVTYADAVLNISVRSGNKTYTASLTKNGVAGEAVVFTEAEIREAFAAAGAPNGAYGKCNIVDVVVECGKTAAAGYAKK